MLLLPPPLLPLLLLLLLFAGVRHQRSVFLWLVCQSPMFTRPVKCCLGWTLVMARLTLFVRPVGKSSCQSITMESPKTCFKEDPDTMFRFVREASGVPRENSPRL